MKILQFSFVWACYLKNFMFVLQENLCIMYVILRRNYYVIKKFLVGLLY